MYQRLAMLFSAVLSVMSAADAEDERHEIADDLIRHREEDAGQYHHDEHHDRRDHDLPPGRPRDLLGLGPNLLEELERTDLRHFALDAFAVDALRLRLGGYARRTRPQAGRPRNSPTSIYAWFPEKPLAGLEGELKPGRSGGTRTPNPRFWRPVL